LGNRNFSLKRTRTPREIIKKLIILCEDTYAAPDYLLTLGNFSANPKVKIDKDKLERGAGEPKTLIDKAITHRDTEAKKARKDGNEDINEVWVVFDRDKHEHFAEPIKRGETKGVNIAYAIPCFELWLILHFECHNRPDHHHEVQRKCKTLIPEYGKDGRKTANFSELVKSVEKAEKHADWLQVEREKEATFHGNPSTTIQHLTRKIRGVKS
jgi:RloB-like protein